MRKITIAIDGYSSTGKSTLARQLAAMLHYTYIDSGAMYRAITLYFLKHGILLHETEEVVKALREIELDFHDQKICLNGVPVENEIRGMDISSRVSEVSALEAVREFAVKKQQELGKRKGIVMDGRDIGTTVFPDAELKIYLLASEAVRVQRRFEEMRLKDPLQTIEGVAENLRHRDHLDSTREISPLRKAADARELDNSYLSMHEQLTTAYHWAKELIEE